LNDEPPVTAGNWIHHALVGVEYVCRLPAAAIAVGIGLLGGIVGGIWYATLGVASLAWIACIAYILSAAGDWTWLAWLPRKGLSFGPVKPPLLGLLLVRLPVGLVSTLGHTVGVSPATCAIADILLQATLSATVFYTTGIEPFRLGITTIQVHTPKLPQGKQLRLVQLSDLHVERITRRERAVIREVEALNADYLLLTGDYLSFSYVGEDRAVADARKVLGALRARCGIYAVRGTHQVDPNALLPRLFAGLPIRWLRSEHVTLEHDGFSMTFAGASSTRVPEIDIPAVERALEGAPQSSYIVLLYHTPERMAQAIAGGADLYLAGHTHGGQLRLPIYGAIVTASDAGKRYEMGRYEVEGTTLYVSRGIGMEGRGAPRARLFCPPEIVCVDVVGTG
jgi:predicted MPP superfamily phosphohydrolase